MLFQEKLCPLQYNLITQTLCTVKCKNISAKHWLKSRKPDFIKEERLIESAQQAAITVKGKEVLNFCANNYLGLSNHPRLIKASQEMMNNRGYGMSSVRFICGTQDIHKELEGCHLGLFPD